MAGIHFVPDVEHVYSYLIFTLGGIIPPFVLQMGKLRHRELSPFSPVWVGPRGGGGPGVGETQANPEPVVGRHRAPGVSKTDPILPLCTHGWGGGTDRKWTQFPNRLHCT